MTPELLLRERCVSPADPPLVIAEVGINHEGDVAKAFQMIDDAAAAGCECVKFQSHVVEDEMLPNDVVPGNATESIWDIMVRCALTEEEERALKERVESLGMLFLSTPFSRAAADRLHAMDVMAYKIGSGECNNYPLVRHIASFGKPVILSTGMNDLSTIEPAVTILREAGVPFALLHATSLYPTPYELVRLGGIGQLAAAFPDAVVGLSDHSLGIYTSLGAVALGASVLEKHFTSDKTWPGPDVPISIDPSELAELIEGARAIHLARGGEKSILAEENPTIAFAYACVVTTAPVAKGEEFTPANLWVRRPGTGEILARHYDKMLGRRARRDVPAGQALSWDDIEP